MEESRKPPQPGFFDLSKSIVCLLSSQVYNRG
jgi:hypothetical protein